jgi:hypothetical protein
MVYVLAGYETERAYGSRRPTWEPAQEYAELESAVAAGKRWLREQPLGQVEVIELLSAHTAEVVRVVTPRGVEVIDSAQTLGMRSRLRAWMGRPPQVFVIGVIFAAIGTWMVAAPETFDDRPASFVRGLGVVVVAFFGVGTLVAFVRWRRTNAQR